MRASFRSLYLHHDRYTKQLHARCDDAIVFFGRNAIRNHPAVRSVVPFNGRCMTSSPTPDSSNSSRADPSSPSNMKTDVKVNEDHADIALPFPWRVNATEPLPRVVNQDDYSGMAITPWARFTRKVAVALELNTSWLDIILWNKWEHELVQSCAFAFQRAVCGLLSRSFQVPIKDICQFDDLNCKSLSINTLPDSSKPDQATMTEEDKNYTERYISVRLESAFMIPHLTRSDVYADSSLRGAYTAIEKKWRETGDTDAIIHMGKNLQTKTKHKGTKRSLLVDVSVICLEKFQLRDKVSGKVLSGDEHTPKEQIVTHLVRFEMETDRSTHNGGGGKFNRELGHWKIVDMDDLLKGNTWY